MVSAAPAADADFTVSGERIRSEHEHEGAGHDVDGDERGGGHRHAVDLERDRAPVRPHLDVAATWSG